MAQATGTEAAFRAAGASAFDRLVDALGPAVSRDNGTQVSARCPAHGDTNPSLSITRTDGRALVYCQAGCATVDVLAALDLTMADLYDNPRSGCTYRYDDGRVVRRTTDKRFWQEGRKVQPAQLYRAAKVKAAVAAGERVIVVEGEADVAAVEATGGVATCNPMGAGKAHKTDWTPLAGARVWVVADRDDPGIRHGLDVKRLLEGLNPPARVRLLLSKVGKDVSDHIAAGYRADDLVPVLIERSLTS
jgi:DNA primase